MGQREHIAGGTRASNGMVETWRNLTMHDDTGKRKTAPIGARFLTLIEAAEVLRLSTRTVREYVRRGEIKGRIIGNRWRFRREDVDAFFEAAPRSWEFVGKNGHGD
jgi:excisionase family DNA binding protein